MRRLWLVSALLLASVLVWAAPAAAGTFSTDFEQFYADRQSDEMIGAIITMADQVDLTALQAELYARHADRREWHEAVVTALQAKATQSQADILAQLDDLSRQGLVSKYRGLWLGNVVLVTALPQALDIIVAREDVLEISPNYEIESIDPVDKGGDEPMLAGVELGLEAIRADEVWDMGYTGEGRLVSHLDTGVDGNHPALASRWRGLDPRYANNPEWAWFDPVTNTDFPFDGGAHGTHTMGTICGLGETSGDTIGVAFGAEWMCAGVIDRVSIPQTVNDALLSFQWLADPDENPSTVWDVPDVCSNSWGLVTGHGYPPCDQTFWSVLDGLEAAGVVVVFAAGNEGPGANSLRRPADRATTDFSSFSVGALDGNNNNLPIADFSSRGPSNCTPDGTPTFKPEVSAPGVNVRSSVPGGGYQGGWSGTSMACPHVAGVVALMRQANPNLTVEQIKQIMLETAADLGDTGEDNAYGMGIVDAYEAVLRALAYLEGWGTLAGQITDEATGQPIHGARVEVLNEAWSATSRANGWYYLFMPADTLYDLKVSFPPTHLPIFDEQMVTENETTFVDYALEGKVTVALKASFGNPEDVVYRTFYLKGSWDNDGFFDASWSGDLIAIMDNGVAPDQTAGDGIFTGSVMLARDEVNTYSWAIYSENYGGEAARLDDGADFDIPNLNPPVVPTLAVNPSGFDNNWIFSVEGDNGLSLDLMPGINSRPEKWGAADSLETGVTYTFRFQVMHSDVASYGSGGLGGPDLHFTPDVDGAYDFIFDDRYDSYVVQLSGTEGPPVFLGAQSGLDGHIPVSWLPPGTTESSEMAYDDGVLANAYYYYAAENLMATMFVPESYPVTIDSVLVHVLTEGDPYWPWPDPVHDPVGISIYLDDGTGMPEADPVFYTTQAGEPGEWVRVDVEEITVSSGPFWVAMNNLSDFGPYDGLGLDVVTDYPANKWVREFGTWMPLDMYTGDHMIRAKVFGGDRSTWLGYDDATPAGEISSQVHQGGNSKSSAGTDMIIEAKPATKMANPISRLAYHPKVFSGPGDVITDTQVLAGYNLYRDTSPAPFDRDLMINSDLIIPTNYDDWGDDIYGPIINGVTYFYQASAVYDIGGGNFVEVGPSNEASGTAQNHPPVAPVNLLGDVSDHDVTLTWDPNSDYDIASYNIYRRDYNQSDFNLVGNVGHPTTTFQETIAIDGIYRYKIKAVDTGGMVSENFSNYIDVAVGLIPPGVLSATDDEEFQISLDWRNPGGRTQSDVQDIAVGVVMSDYSNAESEVRDYLLNSGEVSSVTFIDAQISTPTFEDLEPYDMLLVWTNYTPQNGVALGDVLAEYAETGKGIVALEFAFTTGWGVSGRFISEYSPFGVTSTGYMQVSLGDYDDGHPLMQDVSSLGDYFVFQVPVQNDGEVVAWWNNGWPAVAYNSENPNIVGINAYVGYPDRQWTGDMLQLVLNSVIFVSSGSGIQPDGFVLYKAPNEAGPYAEIGDFPGEQHDFVDSPVPNAVPYYYKVTAIWDGEESDPSNTAMGIAMNYPPEPPAELEAVVDHYDVNLTWTFTDLMGDLDHYAIYRKLTGETDWTFVGTSTVLSYTDEITPGEDGVYRYVVTAVDDGSPQLESAQSNSAFAPVGNLPPVNLRATSDQESVVPLHWSEPGILPCSTIAYDDGALMNAYYYYAAENIIANEFVAVAPIQICTLFVHVLTEGDPYWPWPDPNHDPVEITVWESDGGGYPGEMIHSEIATAEYGEWIAVALDPPLDCNTDEFWVGMNNISDFGPYDGMGLDGATDYPQYKWAREFGSWYAQDMYYGDQMIRASIVSGGRSVLLTENNPTVGPVKAAPSPGSAKSAANAANSSSFSMLTKQIGNSDQPRPLDTEILLGYNLYRATAPNVPVDDAHKINTSPVVGTSYDDESVTNGTPYYYVAVAVYDNDGDIEFSPPSNEVSATPRWAGQLAANPSEIDTSAHMRDIVVVPVTLSNAGGLPVNFSVETFLDQLGRNEAPPAYKATEAKFSSRVYDFDKSNPADDQNNPPLILDQGGPDEFGYVWIDSDEPGGPTFNWVDIEGIGQPLYMYDDDNQGPFPMEFDFSFYGQMFNTFRVCSNGWISFTSTMGSYWNETIPNINAPENLIAPFWDDLNPSGGAQGMIYFYTSDDSVVVSWIDVAHYYDYNDGGPYTFQIILTSDGKITYQYLSMAEPTYSCTIGIQDGTQTIGLMIAYEQYYLHDEMAIRINPGWLNADPRSGVVEAGGNFMLDVILDASTLESDIYYGSVVIHGWDQNHSLPDIDIPVSFRVDPLGIEDQVKLLPREFALEQNYPNPFNARTEIRYALPYDSDVKLEVYNVLGQKVATLVDGRQTAGFKTFIWDSRSATGEEVSSGMYLYRLQAADKTFVNKMLLLK